MTAHDSHTQERGYEEAMYIEETRGGSKKLRLEAFLENNRRPSLRVLVVTAFLSR